MVISKSVMRRQAIQKEAQEKEMAKIQFRQNLHPSQVRFTGIESEVNSIGQILSYQMPADVDITTVNAFESSISTQLFDASGKGKYYPNILRAVVIFGMLPISGKEIPAILKIVELNYLKFTAASRNTFMVYLTIYPQGQWPETMTEAYFPKGPRQEMILGAIWRGEFVRRTLPDGSFNPQYSRVFG